MAIEPGTKAPDFLLRDQHGQRVTLAGPRGEGHPGRNVVLHFFPYAFSGVCTGELRALRDRLPALLDGRAHLLAVSCDSFFSLRVMADQEGFGFPLLSDFWPHGEVARGYGVFDEEKGCARRGTFVIDAGGVVRWSVVNDLPDARDLDDYASALASL